MKPEVEAQIEDEKGNGDSGGGERDDDPEGEDSSGTESDPEEESNEDDMANTDEYQQQYDQQQTDEETDQDHDDGDQDDSTADTSGFLGSLTPSRLSTPMMLLMVAVTVVIVLWYVRDQGEDVEEIDEPALQEDQTSEPDDGFNAITPAQEGA